LAKELTKADHDVMIVGHMPFLQRLASLLLAGNQSAGAVEFTQGAVVWLERNDRGAWSVRFVTQPG